MLVLDDLEYSTPLWIPHRVKYFKGFIPVSEVRSDGVDILNWDALQSYLDRFDQLEEY